MEEFREVWRFVLTFAWEQPGWTLLILLVLSAQIAAVSSRQKRAIAPTQTKADQPFEDRVLSFVTTQKLSPQRVMGLEEARIYVALSDAVAAHFGRTNPEGQRNFPIYPQVPFRAMFDFERQEGLALHILSKRPDFTIVDYSENAILVIEYNGVGRVKFGQADTVFSDAVKREALRRLGIGLIAIASGETADSYCGRVIRELEYYRKHREDGYKKRVFLGEVGSVYAT